MHSASLPAFSDNNSSALAKFTMQKYHNPHDETIAPSRLEEGLLGSNFSACVDEIPNDHHCLMHHEHVHNNDNGDLSDMWENWLKTSNELQTLDNVLFDVPSSACICTLPNFSSQTSANSLPNKDTSGLAALETSFIHPSQLSSEASPYAANEHNLHSFYKNNHANKHPDTSMGSLMEPYPPPLGINLSAPVSPPPLDLMAPVSPCPLELKPRAGYPLLYFKARASSHKMKTAGAIRNLRNNGTRKNEAETFLVESIEDGYVWHKYGQKIIKNRMHPRSYFKCAHRNCPVRRQTESSSDKQGFLLITYFGKHNHLANSKNPSPTA